MLWVGQGGMGLTFGTGTRILPKPSPNIYGRGVADDLMHVGTTASVLSTTLAYLTVFLVASPSRLQYSPPQPLIYGVYTPPATS